MCGELSFKYIYILTLTAAAEVKEIHDRKID